MKINENKDAFLKGTVSLSVAVILTKIMGVLYKVPLSYILGDEGMGYFNSAYAIYSFLYILCSSGVPKAISISLAERGEGVKDNAAYSLLKNAVVLFMKIGIAITAINILCAPALVNLIGNKKSLYTVIAIAPSMIFVSVSGVLRGAMNYYNKLSKIALSQLIEAVIKLVLGLGLAFLGSSMRLPLPVICGMCVLGITIGSSVSAAYLYVAFKTMFFIEKTEQSDTQSKEMLKKSIYKIALPISFGAAMLNLGGVIDLGIIMNRLTDFGMTESEANAIYGNYTTLAVPMVNLVISLISPIMLAFLPKLACAYNDHHRDEAISVLRKMLYVHGAIAIPAACAFYFYSFELLDILFSVSSAAIGAELLIILSLGLALLSLLTIVNTALEAQGSIRLSVISLIIGSVVKAVGNFILIARFGVIGAPLSTVISYGISFLISLIGMRDISSIMAVIRISLFDFVSAVICFTIPYALIYSSGSGERGLLTCILSSLLSCILYFAVFTLRFLKLDKEKC